MLGIPEFSKRNLVLRRAALHLLLLLTACLGLAAAPLCAGAQTAGGQTTGQQAAPADPAAGGGVPGEISAVVSEQWTRQLDLIEQQLHRVDTTADNANRFLDLTAGIRSEAEQAAAALQPLVENLERRLEALGPAPEEGAPAEAPEMARQRQELQGELQQLKAKVSQANLAIVRADELDKLAGSLTQQKRFEALFRTYPPPWSSETLRPSLPEFLGVVEKMLRSPLDWWQSLGEAERRQTVSLRIAALLALALVVGWFLRHWLLSRYGRDPGVSEPSYGTRLVAAIANAVARGIVPALMFGGLLYLAWASRAPEHSLFWALISILFAVLAFFSLAWALPYAVLSPDLPQWRLLPVSPENARKLGWRFTLLAALFAVRIFMTAAHAQIGVSDSYYSLATFLLSFLPALVLIDMSRQRFWHRVARQPEEDETEAGGAAPAAAAPQSAFWHFVRRLVALAAVVSIFAALLGYADLADFLVTNLLLSIITLAALAILRGLARELIGAGLRSGFMREALEIRHVARNRIKFWLRALLDASLLLLGALIIAAIWSSPFGEFWAQARRILSGVTVGGVTISFSDLAVALAVFGAILLITRLGQRFLTSKVLPQTGFDTGVQNSLSAGFGYIGILLAAVFGISALGIDLSNIALIAGALSVGIGFGLQAIVSNFVSGIILLIERPIKAGDWVLVGGNEGLVKRITVRSTELTTFQRASVIIPNSEFISTSVINWTHKDTYGRIEISVGVAYGSDVEKVREVLLNCASHHEKVLTSPEPQVLFMNFGNSSLDFELRCFTNEVSYRLIISSDLRFAIDKAFREAGIEIPFPQHVIHFADQANPLKSAEPGQTPPA
ncbi:mechanosensitive ion channel family protein [Pelagibius marinus]|uniref:mechanosensitive ion channel family protein n=1 Tax=Pelagibius marinus TaxID=2762760 RepID=UPI0018731DAE|nr:mechanosensitive ion channel domain-containing protein [Pelagibius marinus]